MGCPVQRFGLDKSINAWRCPTNVRVFAASAALSSSIRQFCRPSSLRSVHARPVCTACSGRYRTPLTRATIRVVWSRHVSGGMAIIPSGKPGDLSGTRRACSTMACSSGGVALEVATICWCCRAGPWPGAAPALVSGPAASARGRLLAAQMAAEVASWSYRHTLQVGKKGHLQRKSRRLDALRPPGSKLIV
jgi:hypothetical protein